MDIIQAAGAKPANFLDVGSGVNSEQVEKELELILQDNSAGSADQHLRRHSSMRYLCQRLFPSAQSQELGCCHLQGSNLYHNLALATLLSFENIFFFMRILRSHRISPSHNFHIISVISAY
jgi:hypothetical protein